jgi:hypothetical protein
VKLSFLDIARQTIANTELVRQWERLSGNKFARSPLDCMIDEATGHGDAVMEKFLAFVYDVAWCRLPPDILDADSVCVILAMPGVVREIKALQGR